jgi:chlorite dismutase
MEELSEDVREEERGQRKFLKYTFFKVAREWRHLRADVKQKGREEFLEVVDRHSRSVGMRFYSLVGVRGDADFMIWTITDRLEEIQSFVSDLLATWLGKYLEIPYSYLAMSKGSKYLGGHRHEGQEGATAERSFGSSRYLFVYPFVKKREWYRLPFRERQRIMAQHFAIGHKYPRIKINTGYSFGLDDQEFVLAFEGDSPAEFLDLVEELRSSEASMYTQLETPIFTCIAVQPAELLKQLG